MRIVRKIFYKWDHKIKRRLKYATFENGFLRKFMIALPRSRTIVIFSHKHIMGWAFAASFNGGIIVNIFINERYRKRGLATILVNELLKDFSIITLCQWDGVTQKFFSSLQKNHPNRIKIVDWWQVKERYEKIIAEISS